MLDILLKVPFDKENIVNHGWSKNILGLGIALFVSVQYFKCLASYLYCVQLKWDDHNLCPALSEKVAVARRKMRVGGN